MCRILRSCCLVAVLLMGAACSGDADQVVPDESAAVQAVQSAQPDTPVFRAPSSTAGRLRLTDDSLSFAPCGDSAVGVTVRDLPDGSGAALIEEFGAGDGVMTMLRVEDGAIAEIRYAGPEGPDCSRLPPIGDVEARGNEPFWTVRVTGTTATVYTPDRMGGVTYAGGTWSRPADGQWRFEASGEGDSTLVLELDEGTCTDSMSGARFPLSAILSRDGRRLRGCAHEGRG